MDFAIFWLPIIGGILLGGIAVGAWYGGNRIAGLWLGFGGILCLLLIVVLQIQQAILKVSPPSEPPSIFVTGMGLAFGHSIGTILDHSVRIPTLVGQPVVNISVQSVDRSAFDVDMAAGFLIDKALPLQRPAINPPDKATPGAVIPTNHAGLLSAVCPFVISEQQQGSIAHKREFFMVYGWVRYNDSARRPHETGFGGIWDVSKSAFDLPKQPGYNYQK
jgi:hypothetical protein